MDPSAWSLSENCAGPGRAVGQKGSHLSQLTAFPELASCKPQLSSSL